MRQSPPAGRLSCRDHRVAGHRRDVVETAERHGVRHGVRQVPPWVETRTAAAPPWTQRAGPRAAAAATDRAARGPTLAIGSHPMDTLTPAEAAQLLGTSP